MNWFKVTYLCVFHPWHTDLHGPPLQRRDGGAGFGYSVFSPLRSAAHVSSKRVCCLTPPHSLSHVLFLLSWRRLQWERPHALLEEWERFIKDWRDCTLAVFYWRIPPFLRASLLQQHRYVCFISSCVLLLPYYHVLDHSEPTESAEN